MTIALHFSFTFARNDIRAPYQSKLFQYKDDFLGHPNLCVVFFNSITPDLTVDK